MGRQWMGVAVVAALIAVQPSGASAQRMGQVFVEVTRASTGDPVTDLAPDAFTVVEDDREAGIVSAAIDDEPMKIALLVDNGDRLLSANALNPLRDGLHGFIDTLAPQHEVSLLTIGRSIQQRADFTTDRVALAEAVGLVFPDQGAAARMLDGVRETWERRFDEDDAFPVLVLVLTDGTEGSGNYNDNQYADLLNPLVANGVTVHAVLMSTRGGGQGQQQMSQYAINIVENTGGRYESFASANGYAQRLTDLAERMNAHFDAVSSRYRLVYERPDPPGSQVSVTVAGSDLRFSLFIDRRMPR